MLEKIFLNSDKSLAMYNYIKDLPIIDYHNHLSLDDLKNNTRFLNIYDLWIKSDPYKHRAMRMYGVEEKYITGDMPKEEKFLKWCEIFPYLIGNPLYIWSLMELEKVFGISVVPDKENGLKLYKDLNNFLENNEITPEYLLKLFNVELICPCVSITDSFEYFYRNKNVKPSLRGDDILTPNIDFINKVSKKSKLLIKDLSDYKDAISILIKEIKNSGCVFSDHAIDAGFKFYEDDGKEEERFLKVINNETLSKEDKDRLFSHLLIFVCEEYAKYGFVLQLHIGAKRETSDRLKFVAGTQGGYAAIGNSIDISSLINFFNTLEKTKYGIPKTILFTLNPSDNAMISVLSGSFSKDGVSGLITQGPAWWWVDHKKGIVDMLENNAAFGSVCNFVGMTTDSRSFLSLIRHDYFRRILCDWFANKCSEKEFLNSDKENKKILNKLCYENAKNIFERSNQNV